MDLYATIDKEYGIGYINSELFSIPENNSNLYDKSKNYDYIVMGFNTFKSLTRIYRGIEILVITSNSNLLNNTIEVNDESDTKVTYLTLEMLFEDYIKNPTLNKKILVLGGNKIYNALWEYCDRFFITFVNERAKNVDTYFPVKFNDQETFHELSSELGKRSVSMGVEYYFHIYENLKKKEFNKEDE